MQVRTEYKIAHQHKVLKDKSSYVSPCVCEYSRKLGRFRKGLVHGFGQKLAIFQCFYYMQNRQEKCV